MDQNKVRRLLLGSAILSAVGFTTPAFAQLQDIVVTARKRSENLQDVPVSVTAVSAETLARAGISGTDQIASVTPGLNVARQGNAYIIFLRGVGTQNGAAGNEPSVALYEDGVYNPSSETAIKIFNNVDRVEVLKGPQGTLFGRNATGGLVNVITRDPSQDKELNGSIGFGRFGTIESRAYVTGGLAPDLAMDFAASYKYQDKGYIYNTSRGEDTSKEKDVSVRSKILFTPGTARFRIVAAYDKMRSSLGTTLQPIAGTTSLAGTGNSGNFYTVANDPPVGFGHEYFKISADGEVDLSDSVSLFSISAFQHENNFFRIDQDGSPVRIVDAIGKSRVETFSQELQARYDRGSVKAVGGLFLYRSTAAYRPISIEGAAAGGLEGIDIFGSQRATSYAAFGEVNLALSEATGLTVGGRYTIDKLRKKSRTNIRPAVGNPPPYEQGTEFKKPTWRISLDHKFTPDFMGYVSYSRGYKTGQYNLVVLSGVPEDPVSPETLDSFEAGIKAELLDNKVRFNASAFYYDYKDIQVVLQTVGGNFTDNAASARVKGVEAELQVSPFEGLQLNASASYLDAKYKEYNDAPLLPPLPTGGNDASVSGPVNGRSLPRAPKFSYNIGVAYKVPVGASIIDLNANYYHTSSFAWSPDGRVREGAYGLLNSDIGISTRDETLRFGIWGRNLTKTKYSMFTFVSPFGDLYSPAAPRTFGATLAFKFN